MNNKITKTVLASLLLTGTAGAAEVYKGTSSSVNTDVTFQGYIIDDYNNVQRNASAAAEMLGMVDFDNYFATVINPENTLTAVIKIDIAPGGYNANGDWTSSGPSNGGENSSDFVSLDKSYLELDNTELGIFQIGSIAGLNDDIVGYSDVDIFIGTPGVAPSNSRFFGYNHANGFRYNTNSIHGFTFGLQLDAGHYNAPYNVNITLPAASIKDAGGLGLTSRTTGASLMKNGGVAVSAQYKVTLDQTTALQFGAAFHAIDYRSAPATLPAGSSYSADPLANIKTNKAEPFTIKNNNMSSELTASAQYMFHGQSLVGFTAEMLNFTWDNSIAEGNQMVGGNAFGSTQDYHTKVTEKDYGFQAAFQYDVTGQSVGFRPSIQYDYRKTSSKSDQVITAMSVTTGKYENYGITNKNSVVATSALEVGLSYYVTPNFAYIGAMIMDLRNNNQIRAAQGLAKEAKVYKSNLYGVGVLYKF